MAELLVDKYVNHCTMNEETGVKPTVLIVDDEEDLLFLVQFKLRQEGFSTLISPNAENLMDIITHKHPDIIMLDLHMEGIDGGSI
jgi:CheY-like chemotaxis protein